MRSMHRRLVLAPVLILAAALAVSPAMAETTSVKVPFSFDVAGKTFPAGDYLISEDSRGDFVILAAKGSSYSYTGLLGPGAPSPWESKVALKFDQVGGEHLLQSIQCGRMITGSLDKKALESERLSAVHSGGR